MIAYNRSAAELDPPLPWKTQREISQDIEPAWSRPTMAIPAGTIIPNKGTSIHRDEDGDWLDFILKSNHVRIHLHQLKKVCF